MIIRAFNTAVRVLILLGAGAVAIEVVRFAMRTLPGMEFEVGP